MQANLTGIRQRFADVRHRWDKAKQTKTRTFWIAIGAVVLALYLGFAQAGWVTGGTASRMAETSAQDAVVQRLAPICVAQFNADPERTLKLAEFKELSAFNRSNYVSDQGWATMPGETDSDRKVANLCASQLLLIDE